MTVLLGLLAILFATHLICVRRARRVAGRLMRPAAQLEAEDYDRWLALIEPFPLKRSAPR